MIFEKRLPLILKLGFREAAIGSLKSYIDLLWSSNKDLNLISRQMTFEELIDNHILDCLLPLPYFPKEIKKVADFGSGGGMPGVIYALQFPYIHFQLFEKSPKKQEFLNLCKTLAPNLEIKGQIPLQLEGVDLITARAFKPIDVILDMSRDHFQKNGKYFLLKGRKEKIEEEFLLARKKFKSLRIQTTALISPVLDVERNLVTLSSSE